MHLVCGILVIGFLFNWNQLYMPDVPLGNPLRKTGCQAHGYDYMNLTINMHWDIVKPCHEWKKQRVEKFLPFLLL